MGKKTIRLLPDRMIYIGKIESWLHDMAKQGLILKRLRLYYAVFEEGEPQDIEYRIITQVNSDLNDEKLEKYKNNGYELVSTGIGVPAFELFRERIRYHVFKCTVKDNPRDMHGDLVDSSFLYFKYEDEKKRTVAHIVECGMMVFLGLVDINRFSYRNIFHTVTIMGLSITCLILLVFFVEYRIKLKKSKEVFTNINTIDHMHSPKQDWKENSTKNRIKGVVRVVFVIIAVQSFLSVYLKPFLYSAPKLVELYDKYVSTADIEGYGYDLDSESIDKPKLINNKYGFNFDVEALFAETNCNFFVPIYYYASSGWSGTTTDGKELEAYSRMNYFKSTIPFVHKKGYHSWQDDYMYRFLKEGEIEVFSTDYFKEIAWFYSEEHGMHMCMYNNKEFIYLYYDGDKAPQEIVEAITYKLTN